MTSYRHLRRKIFEIGAFPITRFRNILGLKSRGGDISESGGALPEVQDATAFCCPNCRETRAKTIVAGASDRPPMVQCLACSAEMFWPIPSVAELVAYYKNNNDFSNQGRRIADAYLVDPHPTRTKAAAFAADLKANGVPDGGVVIELGCSYGTNVIELRRLGYDAWGVDPSAEGMAWLNANGGKGHCGTLDDFPLSRIDAVFSSHALEHMPNPYATLRSLHALMPPGGYMELALPNWGSLLAQHKRDSWKWFSYPAHLHYFRSVTLPSILREIGFEVLSCETPPILNELKEVLEGFGAQDDSNAYPALLSILTGHLAESLAVKARRA